MYEVITDRRGACNTEQQSATDHAVIIGAQCSNHGQKKRKTDEAPGDHRRQPPNASIGNTVLGRTPTIVGLLRSFAKTPAVRGTCSVLIQLDARRKGSEAGDVTFLLWYWFVSGVCSQESLLWQKQYRMQLACKLVSKCALHSESRRSSATKSGRYNI